MKKIFIFFISIFPLLVNASVLGYDGFFYDACEEQNSGYGPSHLCRRYTVDGDTAVCLDPAIPNPDVGLDVLVEETITASSGNFEKGLIAIANYINIHGVSSLDASHAYRIYTAKVSPRTGNILKIRDVANASVSGTIADVVNIGLCAAGKITCDDIDRYLTNSQEGDSMSSGGFTITKTNQKVSSNGKRITVISDVEINSSSNEKPLSCNASGFSCSVINVNGNTFQVKIDGSIQEKSGVKVNIVFDGTVDSSFISSINIYSCSGRKCSKWHTMKNGFQRFIKINPDTMPSNIVKNISITLPSVCDMADLSIDEKLSYGCCDSIDPSTLIENSEEEEKYIDACGPIVVIENNCGADSCNDSSYKDYTHSYVRQKTMESIMKGLDNGQKDSLNDYLDYSVNEYCGVYTSEKIDTLMPATAVSVSGQFFIFDKYNDLNCTTETSCLRQPYISGKIKATFFTDYKKWKSDYESAKSAEESAYYSWQSAVKNVKSAYDAYDTAQKNYNLAFNDAEECVLTTQSCSYYPNGKPYSCIDVVDEATCNSIRTKKNDAYDSWKKSYEEIEPNAQQEYKSAVNRRMNLQEQKEQCVIDDATFRNNFEYDFSPQLEFIYSQTSHTSGTKDYKMNMVSNTTSVKYWPNTTTTSMSNVDYLGDNAAGLDTKTATNKNINNYKETVSRQGGYYLIDDKGTLGSYSFPDGSHDGCSGSACTTYEYTNKSFTSIKTVSNDATDPYGKITNKDEISMIYFYRPDINTFALMNSGEYKTLHYDANEAITQINGLEVGYVYNLELTAYKGQYTTNFIMNNVGYRGSKGGGYTQELIDNKVNEVGIDSFASTCNYCNYEMAFKRECPECDPDEPGGEFTAQFYYRSISLSDVNPNDKPEGETNWTDAKGLAAEKSIEAVSGKQIIGSVSDDSYLAMADGSTLNKQNVRELDYTYLADSSGYDIYDDESKEFLEYEITLTPKDMQIIKKNSAKANFDYSKMNMCGVSIPTNKDVDNDYCFKCNKDMKECESSFVTAFFGEETDLNRTRTKKWKYYVNGLFCKGSINTCLGGNYPDPVFAKSYLAENKNWP